MFSAVVFYCPCEDKNETPINTIHAVRGPQTYLINVFGVIKKEGAPVNFLTRSNQLITS